MELRYNLTRDDYLRGLSLHEGRLKGPLSVLRLAARLLFLLPTGVGALGLLMLGGVYDMLGIFFLPIRIKKRSFVRVLPKQQKPKIIPDSSNFTVTGYKPKPVGNSEIYELREYRHGDSLRNVHWKLSSKSDGLIVKEPNVPIIKNCLIMPFFGDNADENDVVFAKLMYVCRYMIKSIGICFACDRNGNPFEIRCESDILNYFSALYLNTESSFVADTNDFQHYSIFADREEVDLL